MVRGSQQERVGILSCWHVLAHEESSLGDSVVTPIVCKNKLTYTPIATLGNHLLDADGDAAVAWLNNDVPYSPILANTNIRLQGVRDPKVGDILAKVGSRTGYTRAKVTHIGEYWTDYGHTALAISGFYLRPIDNQPQNQLISAPGDSGSVWFDEQTHEAVGLHFAGECNPYYGQVHAKACFMSRVLDRLGVELY